MPEKEKDDYRRLVFTFGRYRGKSIVRANRAYLRWIIENDLQYKMLDGTTNVVDIAKEFYGEKQKIHEDVKIFREVLREEQKKSRPKYTY